MEFDGLARRPHENLVSEPASPVKDIAMTTSTPSRQRQGAAPQPQTRPGVAAAVLALTAVLSFAALLGPNMVADELAMEMSMSMTHYMELLAVNQPRNLLVFMALPVVLAETLAITELAILFRRSGTPAWVRTASRISGLLAGPVMLAIFLHLLLNAVVPLTLGGGWRGPADVIAVGFYLAGVVPLVGITLVELGVIGRDAGSALKWHATFIAVFLVVAHIAMIFGMLDPSVLGYQMLHQH